MVTEDYVSFETAKLLKEKGFEEHVTHYYFTQITYVGFKDYPIGVLYTDSRSQNQNNYNNKVAAPTLQMAMKWLREVHKIHVVVYPYGEYSCDNYQFDVYKNNELIVSKDDGYITYEQAIEAALKYCLENLI